MSLCMYARLFVHMFKLKVFLCLLCSVLLILDVASLC